MADPEVAIQLVEEGRWSRRAGNSATCWVLTRGTAAWPALGLAHVWPWAVVAHLSLEAFILTPFSRGGQARAGQAGVVPHGVLALKGTRVHCVQGQQAPFSGAQAVPPPWDLRAQWFPARGWRNDLRSSGSREKRLVSKPICSQIKSSFINPQSSSVHSVIFSRGSWEAD